MGHPCRPAGGLESTERSDVITRDINQYVIPESTERSDVITRDINQYVIPESTERSDVIIRDPLTMKVRFHSQEIPCSSSTGGHMMTGKGQPS